MNFDGSFNICPLDRLLKTYESQAIKVQVSAKSPLRSWDNGRSAGTFFNMDLMDQSGEIRATAFRAECDKYFHTFAVDKVYYIADFEVKDANKQFNKLSHKYEIVFNGNTKVVPCPDEEVLCEINYNFIPISQLANIDEKDSFNLIGVCQKAHDLDIFNGAGGREFKKRILTLVDTTNACVNVTIWGDEAENFTNFSDQQHPVVLIKGGCIKEYNGSKTVNVNNALKINPNIKETHDLRDWFDNDGANNSFYDVLEDTEYLTIYEAVDLAAVKKTYFITKGLVCVINSFKVYYKACPQCKRKVTEIDGGKYRCENCNTDLDDFKYALNLNICIGDWSSKCWATCFDDIAEPLLGRSAHEIGECLEDEPLKCEDICEPIYYKTFIFKLKAEMKQFEDGGASRQLFTVISATQFNYKTYNQKLIAELKKMTGVGANE
ncbi:replication protein A 70 kDa DNA-binding subunit-like [Musca autumnalis]|uniref:replication protein A 70 kDa DNA-binding subunit-like n=1 Tax=Musca autumnalis TaxID=221902 RepID=UPI003CF14154